MARLGLNVLREPAAAVAAALLQTAGWITQLFAVWATMFAFGIEEHMPAAGLVLLLMNVATIFPLWPGNIGLLQAVVALPLVSYGVAYSTAIAFGLGLQVLEMSVGVGIGLLFLTREGVSLATLRGIPADGPADDVAPAEEPRARARVSG
jgi:glycosyltransferase 2 family protein